MFKFETDLLLTEKKGNNKPYDVKQNWFFFPPVSINTLNAIASTDKLPSNLHVVLWTDHCCLFKQKWNTQLRQVPI